MATVLIVDDHQPTGVALSKLLGMAGHQCVFAQDGSKALRCALHTPPDLVLLDVMMPGMNGLEILKALRCDPRLRSLPIVIYSAVDEPNCRQEAMRLGAQEYCVKGQVDWPSLQQKIDSYVTAAQGSC